MAEIRKTPKRAKAPPSSAVCPVALCPVGMFLSVTGEVRPEALEHILKAGRELMLALKSTVDARADDVGGSARLQRIDVD